MKNYYCDSVDKELPFLFACSSHMWGNAMLSFLLVWRRRQGIKGAVGKLEALWVLEGAEVGRSQVVELNVFCMGSFLSVDSSLSEEYGAWRHTVTTTSTDTLIFKCSLKSPKT